MKIIVEGSGNDEELGEIQSGEIWITWANLWHGWFGNTDNVRNMPKQSWLAMKIGRYTLVLGMGMGNT